MVTNARHPIWLPAATQPGAWAFAILYAIESLSRASLTSIVPIQAYELLQDAQKVSILYFVVGVAGTTATLCLPLLIQRFPRRWVYTAGALMIVATCAAFASGTIPGQALGLFLRIVGASTLAITLNLYIMDFIRRQEFVRSESLRLALSAVSWTVGPALGVYLYVTFGHSAPYLWSALWALALIAVFWTFRLSQNQAIRRGDTRPSNPFAGIRRFVAQPRMRLAWLIAFGRSCYWTTFYVYAPILIVASGNSRVAAGVLVSAANGLLLLALLWGRLTRKIGVRKLIVLSFIGLAACAIFAGLAGSTHPWTAAILLLIGINGAVALDAAGSAPFLRAVHPYERPQMTAVYRTNLDMSELVPALIYSIILGFFGMGAVFATLGLFCAFCALACWRHLPRSM